MSDMLHILQRGYELIWRENDLESAVRGLSPEFEWVVPGHPEGELRRGPEATAAFFREWIDAWEDLHVDWELRPAGPDRVLAKLSMRGRGRGSGVPTEMHAWQLWTFREGQAVRMVFYLDLDEARRAAGLDP
jgi:ketosteroid isomerase-like protein